MEDFTNQTLDISKLPSHESVSFKPLQKDYLNVLYMSNSIFVLLLFVAGFIFYIVSDWARENVLAIFGGLLLFSILAFWTSIISFRKKGYALREKDIVFRRGIIATNVTIVPLNRIQHVALHEGVFSRMYDLSEIQIYTAGGSGSDLRVPGLPKDEAEKIKTFLLDKIIQETEEPVREFSDKSSPTESIEEDGFISDKPENQPEH